MITRIPLAKLVPEVANQSHSWIDSASDGPIMTRQMAMRADLISCTSSQ